jgi:hypothetical protein
MQKSDLVVGAWKKIEEFDSLITAVLSELSNATHDEVVYGPCDDYDPNCDLARLANLSLNILTLAAQLNTFILDGMVKR